jgi:hypothetical protein
LQTVKRSFSLVPKWCAWPVFLGLVAIAVGIFPGSHGAAEEDAATGGNGASDESAAAKPEQNQRHPLMRYESLWQRSLFHAPVQVAVADPAFARDYSLAGIFEMDGSTTAALVRKRDGVVVNVSDAKAAADGADGLKLISVETSGGPSGTKVQVEKGGMRAWIVATPIATSGAQSNAVVAPMATPRTLSAGSLDTNTTEFSDWENFSATRRGASASELPRQNGSAGAPTATQSTPEFSVPPAPKVKQPVPVPRSPLDAAMAADETEIVVPIKE